MFTAMELYMSLHKYDFEITTFFPLLFLLLLLFFFFRSNFQKKIE